MFQFCFIRASAFLELFDCYNCDYEMTLIGQTWDATQGVSHTRLLALSLPERDHTHLDYEQFIHFLEILG